MPTTTELPLRERTDWGSVLLRCALGRAVAVAPRWRSCLESGILTFGGQVSEAMTSVLETYREARLDGLTDPEVTERLAQNVDARTACYAPARAERLRRSVDAYVTELVESDERIAYVLKGSAAPPEGDGDRRAAYEHCLHATKDDNVVLVGPRAAVIHVIEPVGFNQRVQMALLVPEDTDTVIETALGLWDHQQGSTFYLLDVALSAARCV